MFKLKDIYKRAEKLNKTIVFPEASFSTRVLQAIKIIAKEKIAKPILIGDESAIILADKKLAKFQIINPKTFAKTDALAKALYQKRKDKGLSLDQAKALILDPYYFATMLVQEGYADGMVGGAECSTATAVRPALQIIKSEKKNKPVSSCFLIYGKNKFLNDKCLLIGDCAIMANPNSDELCSIANDCLNTYNQLGLQEKNGAPKIAFLSYSSNKSSDGESAQTVKKACGKFKKQNPECICDGELQFDSAMVKRVAQIKCPESSLQGDANILIFPNLDSGNICYKAMQYIGNLNAIGPILQGLKKPVNDLSRGCSVQDIVVSTAITVLQSNKEEK